MIIITGHVRMRAETHAAMVALAIEHCTRSRAEPGCIAHNVHVDCEDGARLVFVEKWADADAVRAHFAVPASQAFVRELRSLADGRTEMGMFEAVEVRGV